ncbi:MAG: hypothetical protein CMJ78_10460 [Planctomycetaceae bacterium]|nr:hypothetical protein [Planctomycetaceae bacterium]
MSSESFARSDEAFWLRSRCLLISLFALFVCFNSAGCSVFMAAKAPHKRNLAVLAPGNTRTEILQEIGPPKETRRTDNGRTDSFAFKQGYSLPVRTGRFLGHVSADLSSLGLWEIVGTPLETAFQGEDVAAEVVYDEDERAQYVEYSSGAHLRYGGPTLARWLRPKWKMQAAKLGELPSTGVIQASGTE